ncbi:hypothetical protein [Streptomyces virginiae]
MQSRSVGPREARAIAGFLRQSYAVTDAGEEFLDLDKLLDEFLAG